MSGRRHKNQPQANNSSSNNNDKKAPAKASSPKRRRRPAPPPQAPKALVALLQKDKKVLKYFTALQSNLEADVQKWKDRARNYQALYEKKQQQEQADNDKGSESPAPQKKRRKQTTQAAAAADQATGETRVHNEQSNARRKDPPPAAKDNAEDGPPETINIGKEPAIAIDDSMFDFQSSDDDNDVDDDDEGSKGADDTNRNKEEKASSNSNGNEDLTQPGSKPNGTTNHSMFQFLSDDDDDASVNYVAPISSKTKAQKSSKNGATVPEPIDDSAFDVPLSSEDESQNVATTSETVGSRQTMLPLWKEHQKFIVSELVDAYRCLQHLGVDLVDKKIIEKEVQEEEKVDANEGRDIAMGDSSEPTGAIINTEREEEEGFSFLPDQSDTQALKRQLADQEDEAKTQTVVFARRTNEDVVTDLLDVLRRLTRVNLQVSGGLPHYHAFRFAPDWIPCGDRLPSELTKDMDEDVVDHPARVGKICIFRALSVMDCYGSAECLLPAPHLGPSRDPWDQVCECLLLDPSIDPDSTQAILIGMLNRKTMVNDLMESLSGEVSGNWAVVDRTARIQTEALLYDETDDIGEEASENNVVGEVTHGESNNSEDTHDDDVCKPSANPKLLSGAGAKSQARLASLAERRLLAQILVSLYLARKDANEAFHSICDYIMSASPSLGVEDYPKMQPVLSMVVLEGMLVKDRDLMEMLNSEDELFSSNDGSDENGAQGDSASWLGQVLSRHNEATPPDQLPGAHSQLDNFPRKVLSLSIHTAGYIWGQRLGSQDNRITDIARTEWACYLRLLETECSWLAVDLGPTVASVGNNGKAIQNPDCLEKYEDCLKKSIDDFQLGFLASNKITNDRQEVLREFACQYALSLALVLLGDTEKTVTLFCQAVDMLDDPVVSDMTQALVHVSCTACLRAFRQLKVRQVGSLNRDGYFMDNAKPNAPGEVGGGVFPETLIAFLQYLKTKVESYTQATTAECEPSLIWNLSATLLQCCSLVSNGEMTHEVIQLLLKFDSSLSKKNRPHTSRGLPKMLAESIEQAADIPFLRVINLERRRDRWINVMAQCMESSVLVARGVSVLEDFGGEADMSCSNLLQASNGETERSFLYGGFAFDGKLNQAEFTSQIFKDAGDRQQHERLLDACVAPRWRPHDLKPFDSKATDDEHALVRVSDTEKACALSHISTWKGVLRSLTGGHPLQPIEAASNTSFFEFQHAESLRRLFLTSGFARGHPLDHNNIGMSPCPVCVVLEDDAILVDRFADRLSSLLEELPRDFHFCSLGYGRPSTAPLVKFSSQLGIPTCIWYLTGYVISLEGAKHLLGSLPVRGPVDSWIGLKMCANWDNSFGEAVGVGVQSKPKVEAPPRKDLSKIMKFRAFAAFDPLCSQKVMGGGAAGVTGGRNWRQRDTDITYSGSENYSG